MSDELTIMLNGREYALTESFKQAIEERAERAFSENWFFDCHWEENERGDPILAIETAGEWVPVDRLERLEFEMAPAESEQDDGSDDDDDETEEVDAGNGMKTIPRDEVDLSPGDGPENLNEEEDVPDTGFMVTHPNRQYVPQPEQDDPEKVPPHPDELPADPTYVQWIPADDSITEHWETGRALIPLSQDISWNLQLRADEAIDGATREAPDEDNGGVKEVPKTNRHDEWEEMMERHDCEVVSEKQLSDEPPKGEDAQENGGYQGREAEPLDGKYGGDNWGV